MAPTVYWLLPDTLPCRRLNQIGSSACTGFRVEGLAYRVTQTLPRRSNQDRQQCLQTHAWRTHPQQPALTGLTTAFAGMPAGLAGGPGDPGHQSPGLFMKLPREAQTEGSNPARAPLPSCDFRMQSPFTHVHNLKLE